MITTYNRIHPYMDMMITDDDDDDKVKNDTITF